MASLGKHLHAAQNSKLAKYAESANFAYLSKQTHNKCKNAKGLRPFKRSEPKNLWHKRKTSAKTPRGFDISKGPNKKKHSAQTHNKSKNSNGPFKGHEPKTNNKKGTISAKRRPTGCLEKIKKWMPERGRGRFFFTRTFGTHHSIYPKPKQLRPPRTTARKKGGRRFFTKKQSFRALPR